MDYETYVELEAYRIEMAAKEREAEELDRLRDMEDERDYYAQFDND